MISNALRFAHQACFLGFGSTRLRDVMRFAFTLRLTLLGAFARDFNADGRGHQIALIIGLRLGPLQLNAFLFGFALCVVHVLALLSQNLFGLRLHQLFRQMNVADQHVDYVNVILQQMRAHASFGTFLFLVPVLQISHRGRLRRLIAKDRINQRMHDVLN